MCRGGGRKAGREGRDDGNSEPASEWIKKKARNREDERAKKSEGG